MHHIGRSQSLIHPIEVALHNRVTNHDVPLPALAGQADFEPGHIANPQEVGCHESTIGATRLVCQGSWPSSNLPVPGTCLRLPVAFATQTGAETPRQAADREDPHPPPCLCRRQIGGSGAPPRIARQLQGIRRPPLGNGSSPRNLRTRPPQAACLVGYHDRRRCEARQHRRDLGGRHHRPPRVAGLSRTPHARPTPRYRSRLHRHRVDPAVRDLRAESREPPLRSIRSGWARPSESGRPQKATSRQL